MFKIENRVGRLIEAQMASPLTLQDVEGIVQRVRLHVLGVQGKAVCCVDITGLDVLPPEATELFIGLFTRDNPRVERSGFLVARKLSSLGIQMDRMIRESRSVARRCFDDRGELQRFLDEVLSPAERPALRSCLDGLDDGPVSASKRGAAPARGVG
jgi:hypothetical protein